jgi:hypothetical protein
MKISLLVTGCLIGFACSAQERPAPDVKKFYPKAESQAPGDIPTIRIPLLRKPLSSNPAPGPRERLLGHPHLGPVYALPQSNMPCIMPDLDVHNLMPNASDGRELRNPIDPGIIPEKKQ